MAASIPSSSSSSSSSSTVVKNKTNYTRLCRLIVDIGSRVLRGVLDAQLPPPADLQRHLNSPGIHSILKTLRSKRVLNTQQWDKLYPPTPGVPSSTTFDITLLFLLLRNTCGLTPPTTGWNAVPLPADLSKEADLIRVKQCRNEITGHSAVMEISDVDFGNHWAEIEATLIRLGGLQYEPEIQRLKIESIDPENDTFLNVLIQSWEEGEDKKLDAIRGEFNKQGILYSTLFQEFKEEIKAEIKCEQQESFCTLPQKPSHDVVNRHDEVSMTLDKIRRLKAIYPNHITVTYLSGNPGCGKSELARQIGEKHFDEIDNDESSKFVATLNASSLENLTQSYIKLAFQLQCNDISYLLMSSENISQEEKLAQLQTFVVTKAQKYSSWLIIVDNVEDLKMVSKFIPHSGQKLLYHGKGHILITTQDIKSIPTSDSHTHHIQLSLGMNLNDAVQSLYTISKLSCNEEVATTVCKTLDFQPLALACASIYMRQTLNADPTMNWERYLKEVQKGNTNCMDELFEDTNLAYQKSMTTAVKMAVEEIIEKSQVMLHTFEFMAAIAPEFLSLDHVIKYVLHCMPALEKNLVAKTITSSSLIIVSASESKGLSLRAHQVVYHILQSVVYEKSFQTSEEELSFFMKFAEVFSSMNDIVSIVINDPGKAIKDTAPIIQHFIYFSEKVKSFFERHDILIKTADEGNLYGVHYRANVSSTHQYIPLAKFLMHAVSEMCQIHDKYLIARWLLEISFCIFDHNYKDDHLQLANVLHIYHLSADVEAKECCLKVLTIKKKIFGSNHPEMVDVLSLLGIVFRRLKELDKAKECFEKALEIEKDDPALLNNFGFLLIDLKNYDKAQECLEKAIQINKERKGNNHLYIAYCLDGLAKISEDIGKLDEATECYEKALAIKESTYGSNHPKGARTLSHLGSVLVDLGKLDEAKECYEKALAIKESTNGSNHPEVATTLNNLGSVLVHLGKFDEAKECYEKALAIEESTYGSNHPKVATTLHNLGSVLNKLEKLDEAKDFYEKALAIEKRTYGRNHPDTTTTLNDLGLVLKKLEIIDEAKDCYEKALAIEESTYGSNHPELTITLNNLRKKFVKLGKLDKLPYVKAISKEEISITDYHELATALSNVGSVLNKLGRLNESKECFEIALSIKESFSGSHASVALTRSNLGTLFYKLEKPYKALECFKEAMRIERSSLGINHPKVAITIDNLRLVLTHLEKRNEANHPTAAIAYSFLGLALKDQRNLNQAKEYFEKALAIEADEPAHWHNLGVLFAEMENYQKAKEYIGKAIQINEERHGSSHLNIANSLKALAVLSEFIGKLDEAKGFYERALAIKEIAYGSNHPMLVQTLYNLESLLKDQGKPDEAREFRERALAISKMDTT